MKFDRESGKFENDLIFSKTTPGILLNCIVSRVEVSFEIVLHCWIGFVSKFWYSEEVRAYNEIFIIVVYWAYLSVEGLLLIFILAQWETTFIGYVLREIL